jgi:hypothetical protein
LEEPHLEWGMLRDGALEFMAPEDAGVFRSAVLGLWLDETAFWRDDMRSMLAPLKAGLASEGF